MVEPLPCLTCPVCEAETVFALRTADRRNHCHCSTCGHVWRDEHPSSAQTAEVAVRLKRDRRQHNRDRRQHNNADWRSLREAQP